MQPGSFSRHQDNHTHCHCYASCTGCQFITELTQVHCHDVQDPQHHNTSVDRSSCASLHGHYACLMHHCLSSLSSGQFVKRAFRRFVSSFCQELTTYLDHCRCDSLLVLKNPRKCKKISRKLTTLRYFQKHGF